MAGVDRPPAEHREGWIAIIRSRHSGRPECANTSDSSTARRTGHVAPMPTEAYRRSQGVARWTHAAIATTGASHSHCGQSRRHARSGSAAATRATASAQNAADLARHPLAALQAEHSAMNAWKEFHVLDRGLSDPSLIHRQRHHFGLGRERHDDLDELFGLRVEGHPDVFLNHLFCDPIRHHETEHLDEELVEVRLACAGRQVHHRPRVADCGERESALRRGVRSTRIAHEEGRGQRRKRGESREQCAAVYAGGWTIGFHDLVPRLCRSLDHRCREWPKRRSIFAAAIVVGRCRLAGGAACPNRDLPPRSAITV